MQDPPPGAPVRTLADVLALETNSWQELLPAESTYGLLCQAAARHPDRAALRFLPSGEGDAPTVDVSYQGLLARVTEAANAFHDAGIGAGQAVALLLPNLPETHYALWGAQAAGIAAPVNPLLDVDHIVSIVEATRAEALVTLADGDVWRKAMAVTERCPSLRTVFVVGLDADGAAAALPGPRADVRVLSFAAELARQPGGRLLSERAIAPDEVCAYFHTGGTTGLPKIARHTHRNEVFVAASLARLQPDRHVVLCGLPLFHVNGAMVTGLGAFHAGWEVVLLTPQGYRGPGVLPNFWRLVQRFGATTFSGVPTIFAALAATPLDGADISSLRQAFCGAAPLPPEVARRFEQAAGIPLCEGYGLTEAACISAVQPAGVPRREGSVGLRLPHQALQAWVVDADGRAARPCAPGEVGVIGICGPNVFPGYLRERDNRGIWLKPGWLNTGDLGFVDGDGYLHLTGRAKDLIIRGGHNIDPALIEDALLRHPDIALAAAVGQPDAHAGELPVAYVTLKPGARATPEALQEAARALVPERAAVPVRVEVLAHMPLTAVGKVAKADLRLLAAEHVLGQLLARNGIGAELAVLADAARGTVVRLRCPPAAAGQARHLLAPFPYPVDLLPPAEGL
ncbi:acyl-CoA synthetase [Pseudoduganella namucuonensis]|uniref:Fatty-acyl-CoA synthase n=1 Tax=Pseudoduganella namucuonensis TaxID=1035707 RepID=A0A1I7LN31_9BURK|nr:acyl-CoA synthetase [Pseudoduganella namucuonensis]SFV11053.1 fatty-acyl-CoA synthase [Pseudoduganella namucuonensis]